MERKITSYLPGCQIASAPLACAAKMLQVSTTSVVEEYTASRPRGFGAAGQAVSSWHCWVGSPGQARSGLLHQNKLEINLTQNSEAGAGCREVLKKEEECWNVKAIAMNQQGSWTRWEDVKESMEHAPDQVPIVLSMMFYGLPSHPHANPSVSKRVKCTHWLFY